MIAIAERDGMIRHRLGISVLALLALVSLACHRDMEMPESVGEPTDSGRLEAVRNRGKLICGSRTDVPGYGYLDESGNNEGFDVDLCRAVAAAVLGDASAIEIRIFTAAERGPVLQSGEIDLLVRTVTWTTARDAQWGNFAQTMFYDG